MATVSQYQATQKGGPLVLATVPKFTPDANEVSIRLKAVALNPLDWKQLLFGQMVRAWPAVFGIDGAGIVEAVGSGVSKFKPGDEVFSLFGFGPKAGAFQEVATVPEHYVSHKPANVSWEEAASFPITYTTAASALYAGLGIPLSFIPGSDASGPKPSSVLVLGGSSGVGAATIQLLRLSFPEAAILTTSSSQHHARLATLGATKCFDYSSPDLIADIKASAPGGRGVEFIVDAVGSGAQQGNIWDTLQADGPQGYAAVVTGAQFEVPEGVKKVSVIGRTVFEKPGGHNAMSALGELVGQGKYTTPSQIKVLGTGFDFIGRGLDELKKGVSGTKLVVSL